jgi:signal transduction histidine kinase
VLLAAAAAAALLHGTLALSERRAAFVSAVTHELRTPLTTFKLYSEMLAEDMVTEPAQRKKYLATLSAEAARLGHLVENVLSYARLERGQARQHREHLSVRELVERLAPRLAERAEMAGLALAPDTTAPAADAGLEIDVAAVEQILFNLVDNACKYAGPDAADRTIHLEVRPAPGPSRFATLRVRDHGPGLSKEAARRLFQPFSRSTAAAARGVPGVGLGLALSRRLARSLGGTLSHDSEITDGAAFLLRLPLGPAPE